MENKTNCIVIGIAGGSGSGKTTFCNQLAANLHILNVKILSTDDYFKTLKPKVTAPFSQKQYDDYDHPSSLDLGKLMNDLTTSVTSNAFDVVIVEGLMVLYFEEIRDKLHLKLFVDCQSDERLIRRVKRDLNEQSFDEITAEYLDLVRHRYNEFIEPTKWFADLIVNGAAPSKRSIEVIQKWLSN